MKPPACSIPKVARKRRRNHSVRNKRRTKRGMVIDLDRVARREIVEERDGNTCQRCIDLNSGYEIAVIQWAHIHTRRYYITRWEPDNSLALCSKCHKWFDNNKFLGDRWFTAKFPERAENVARMLQGKSATNDAWVKSLWLERVGEKK